MPSPARRCPGRPGGPAVPQAPWRAYPAPAAAARHTAVNRRCRAAAAVLDTRAKALEGPPDRLAARDIAEQVTALSQNTLSPAGQTDDELARILLELRLTALYWLLVLGDSAPQAIAVGEPLTSSLTGCSARTAQHPDLAEQPRRSLPGGGPGRRGHPAARAEPRRQERILGADHPETLTARNSLALSYQAAGRVVEAIPILEQNLADQERVLGPDHPSTLTSRNNLAALLPCGGPGSRCHPSARAEPGRIERELGRTTPTP